MRFDMLVLKATSNFFTKIFTVVWCHFFLNNCTIDRTEKKISITNFKASNKYFDVGDQKI